MFHKWPRGHLYCLSYLSENGGDLRTLLRPHYRPLAKHHMGLCGTMKDLVSLLKTGITSFSESHFCRFLRGAEEVPAPMPLPAFKMTKLILTRDRGAQGASDAEKTHELKHEGEATPTRNG